MPLKTDQDRFNLFHVGLYEEPHKELDRLL